MSRLLPRKTFTLCVIRNDFNILLGFKKSGFGVGKWNGLGGKVEDEMIIAAALREVKEECGLELQDITKVGCLEFEFLGRPEIMHVHVFKSQVFVGEICESEEIYPQWFSLDNIPYKYMWPDDKFWLPLLLNGKKFHGYFLYDGGEKILQKRLTVWENMSMM